MNACDFYEMIRSALLGKVTLQKFADDLSELWLNDEPFDDPLRENQSVPMNQKLFHIIEIVFESGEVFSPEFFEEVGGPTFIGEEEFREDILVTFENLIRFFVENPAYDCPESKPEES